MPRPFSDRGLALRTAQGHRQSIAIDAVSAIDQLDPTGDDVVIITAKTQDTPAIHAELFDWNPDVPVVCGTNGVEHERLALRRFARVYGMVVQLPAQFERAGGGHGVVRADQRASSMSAATRRASTRRPSNSPA